MSQREPIKISLTAFVITLIISAIIVAGLVFYIIQDKNNDTEKLVSINTTENTISNSTTINNTEKKQTKGIYIDFSKDTSVVEDGNQVKVTPSNTINYALLKKYGYDEKTFEKYYSKGLAEGDSPNYEIIENEEKLGKYTKPLTFNMAVVKDSLYPDNTDTLINNLKVFKPLLLKERTDWQTYSDNDIPELYMSLNGLSIMNGNNSSEESYNNNSRAKKIQVTINDTKSYTFELKDTNDVQIFDIDYKQSDIGKPITVKVEVLEKYEGLVSEDVYINEIGFGLGQSGYGGR